MKLLPVLRRPMRVMEAELVQDMEAELSVLVQKPLLERERAATASKIVELEGKELTLESEIARLTDELNQVRRVKRATEIMAKNLEDENAVQGA